ncbi:MAG: ABC transporter substrate-binding protein [Haloferacaceae archaeon]
MATDLGLTFAVNEIDRTRPVIDGDVEIEGIDPTVLTLATPERHRRMLKFAEFDVCELSLGSYLASVGGDYPFTAIPAFPYRRFRHGYYFVNADAGIDEPADLEGGRVGVRRWQNTAGVWMRGIAEEYHGVDTTTVEWLVDDEDEIPVDVPDAYDVSRVSGDRNINDLLVDGDLDAIMYPGRPSAFQRGDPNVELLFPDYAAVDRRYYRDTGHFPLMHVIVVRDDVAAEHPWVPTSVRKAFEAANRQAIAEVASLVETRPSLAWAQDRLGDEYDVLGTERELWTDGLAGVRDELETFVDYAVRDGLLAESVDVTDLFFERSLEALPETV